jgi:predicted PurR-regulated permease PerM
MDSTNREARDRISKLLFYGTILLVGYLVYLLFEPFLAPLAWAAILAAFFYPWHQELHQRLGKNTAAGISTAVVALVIIAPAVVILTAFVQEATQAVASVEGSMEGGGLPAVRRAWAWIQQQVPGQNLGDFEDLVRRGTAWLAGFVAARAGEVLRNVAVFVIDLVVTLFAVFFFFRDGPAMINALRRILPFEKQHRERMIKVADELVRATISSGLIVAAVQGFIGGVTFAVLGLGAPVFWGVMMAFFALLPVAGAWVVWTPAAIWLLLSGSVGRGIALIAIGAGVVGLVDNVLRPALLSGRTQLSGLLVFVSLLGGMAAFGLLGLVLGPIVMATAIGLFDAYTSPE